MIPELLAAPNPTGEARTYSTSGAIDTGNAFFQSLGTNGRSCASCHAHTDGWTVTPVGLQARFDATQGMDPVFRPNDGANSPLADVSTVEARRQAYSMLLTKGLIRVGLEVPPNAEFELEAVDDPYGYASAKELSLFRRPLPSTNLQFLATVMWDGRETFAGQTIHFDLSDQANGATLGHAEAVDPLSQAQRDEIVSFETSLFTAQARDAAAGELDAQRGLGGPRLLSRQPFFIGINDTLGSDFTPVAMTLFDGWTDLPAQDALSQARRTVAHGQAVFNTKPINISDVRGLNDAIGVQTIAGTCTTCHNTPNVGNHSTSLPLDISIADVGGRTPDMPLYTLRNKTTGEEFQTTDPGRALITGKWRHRGVFKGPILRGLATRAPYFHNGSAATLEDVVDFYDGRFAIGFTASERADLIAFLQSL